MNADFRDLSVDVDQVYLDRQVSILTAIAKSESPKYEASEREEFFRGAFTGGSKSLDDRNGHPHSF